MRGLLALPALLWLAALFIAPLTLILLVSLAHLDAAGHVTFLPFTLDNYRSLLNDSFAATTLRSLRYAALATLCTLVVGYPYAWFVVRRELPWQRTALLLALLIPFFTNGISRIYGWFILLRSDGLLSQTMTALLGSPTILGTDAAIILGLAYAYLPFMVLAIHASLDRIDPNLLLAASDLGATRTQLFLRVLLPLSMPGVVAGSLLVLVPSLCDFVVPKLLGGAKMSTLGTLLEEQFLGRLRLNWPEGGATTTFVMILIALLFATGHLISKRSNRDAH